MKKSFILFLLLFSAVTVVQAQKNPVDFTPAEERISAFQKRTELENTSLFKNIEFNSIGPSIMSGRVVDIDASPDDPSTFYAAYASGGLWKTTNNGISFKPIFDDQICITIGDIAVDWKNNIIYIGSGENNSSRSSYAGAGIFKTSDDGKSWEYLGLPETHHIGRIILHPDNPNILWVAALGHLYSPNPERGIYKSYDAGKNWEQVLYIDDNTGIIDLVVNPKNPDELYAAAWYRTRRAWDFVGSGKTSGIYKTIDGGNIWEFISGGDSGFPQGIGVGRIGLAIYPENPKVIFALLDNQSPREEKKEEDIVTKDLLRTITSEDFLKLSDDDINDFLDRSGFPKKYNAKTIKEQVSSNKLKPIALVEYLEDANTLLFDTPIIGAEVYRSDDEGRTWKKTHDGYLDDLVYTYGYYFGEMRVSPVNENKLYVLGVPILKSTDGGKIWKSIDQENVHGDYHAMWINPLKDGHLIIGNDGGINISYDEGETWFKANTPAVGQFYSVNVDTENPYNVYGGLQDNGVWYGPHNYSANYHWYSSGNYPYKGLLGGDGMQVEVDTRDNNIVYTGYQFGNYFRVNKETSERKYIKPQHELGERPFRFNWQTPIHLSIHNRDILYLGSNKLHRSLNKGDDFVAISHDLTKGGKRGDVPYGTLTTISESPLLFGLIYTGSDDGLIYVTRDGGFNWNRISDELPQDFWISRVEASHHDTGTVYVSLNGYRWDNFESLVYRSTDYGGSWERIGLNLPHEPVNVIKEDPADPRIIYVGTDHAVYISIDIGETFMGMNNGLPAAPVHDLVVQNEERDLVIGTHGRSLYTANIKYLPLMTDEILRKTLYIFPLEEKTYNESWGMRGWTWGEPNTPEIEIVYFSDRDTIVSITIKNDTGIVLKEFSDTAEHGLNFIKYNLSIDTLYKNSYEEYLNEKGKDEKQKIKTADDGNIYLRPGEYTVIISTGSYSVNEKLIIKEAKKNRR